MTSEHRGELVSHLDNRSAPWTPLTRHHVDVTPGQPQAPNRGRGRRPCRLRLHQSPRAALREPRRAARQHAEHEPDHRLPADRRCRHGERHRRGRNEGRAAPECRHRPPVHDSPARSGRTPSDSRHRARQPGSAAVARRGEVDPVSQRGPRQMVERPRTEWFRSPCSTMVPPNRGQSMTLPLRQRRTVFFAALAVGLSSQPAISPISEDSQPACDADEKGDGGHGPARCLSHCRSASSLIRYSRCRPPARVCATHDRQAPSRDCRQRHSSTPWQPPREPRRPCP